MSGFIIFLIALSFGIAFYYDITFIFSFIAIFIIFCNVLLMFYTDFIEWDKLENLNNYIKKANDTFNENELFIQALKTILLRKKIPLEDIKKQMDKLRK